MPPRGITFILKSLFQRMTSNTRKSKLSSGKQEQYVFTWKVVNGWDYNLGESETASSLAMANVIKLKVSKGIIGRIDH